LHKFLEDKLKAEYGRDSKVPFKVMNSIGAMHGKKETAKGKAMEKKHEQKVERSRVRRIEIHPADNGGHTVETSFHPKETTSAAFSEYEEPKKAVFGKNQHEEMIDHVRQHLGIPDDGGEAESEE
jgi:hypothetical protein